jgi:DNA-directed RNA polymerase specialized sigma24 family protein
MPDPPEHITLLFKALSEESGQTSPSRSNDALFSLVYDNLRNIARQRLSNQRVGHTLGATALVHEAWLRIAGDRSDSVRDRNHFFARAAEGGIFDLATEEKIFDAVALDELICRLEQEDAQAAALVRLRFYAGLSIEETAGALGISPRTAKRDWAYARSWLMDAWQAGEPS